MRTIEHGSVVVISHAVKEYEQLASVNEAQQLLIDHQLPLFWRHLHCRVRQALVKNKQTRLQHVRLQSVVDVCDVSC